ncbi:uncharacterized protein LOC127561560 [Antechinus flavipes]|uniref:uncharacterized protein LOC127561560 n=1 Tax=Antechinus flavipes TaxID=38775 RepID=UPI00223552DE|nr:uncharacterized protein LOC127561560 [Antechinus flavipes]
MGGGCHDHDRDAVVAATARVGGIPTGLPRRSPLLLLVLSKPQVSASSLGAGRFLAPSLFPSARGAEWGGGAPGPAGAGGVERGSARPAGGGPGLWSAAEERQRKTRGGRRERGVCKAAPSHLSCQLHGNPGTYVFQKAQETKLSIVPVRRGYRGNKIGKPYIVPCKVTGCCGSVLVRLIPAPRGTGIVSAPVPKKLLMMAGIDDCYTSARGCTATLGNFAKATFYAISKTYSYLNPDLWKETVFTKSPYQEFTDHLVKTHTRVSVQRTQAAAVATT